MFSNGKLLSTTCLLFLLIGFKFLGAIVPAQPEVNTWPSDDFVEKFCKNVGYEKHVKMVGNRLELYGNPGITKTVLLGSFGALMLTTGIAQALPSNDQAERYRSIVFFILSAVSTTFAAQRMKYHLASTPSFSLDEKGITVQGSLVVTWDMLDQVERIAVKPDVKEVQLRDIFGKQVLRAADGELALPISVDEFIVMINHYWKKYRNK